METEQERDQQHRDQIDALINEGPAEKSQQNLSCIGQYCDHECQNDSRATQARCLFVTHATRNSSVEPSGQITVNSSLSFSPRIGRYATVIDSNTPSCFRICRTLEKVDVESVVKMKMLVSPEPQS